MELIECADTRALARHRDINTTADIADELESRIKAAGVEYVYYQVVTVGSRVVSKVVPAHHLRRNLEQGINFHRTAMADLQCDRHGTLLGGGVAAAEFTALPDADTFAVLPWDTTVGRFLCTAYEPEQRPDVGGRPLPTDVRGHLRRVHADFTARTGLHVKSGCEPEMTWTGPGLEVSSRPGASPAYQFDNLERMRPIYQKVISYAQALGLDMIEGDYEDGGQLELNWMFDHADRTADRLITYRQICRQVARELGVTASFMPKPTTGSMGNGCHHNLSVWRGEENVLVEPGRIDMHLSEPGKHILGGLLTHAAGSMAIVASTVNSYKRFWDAGQFAPSQIDWGMDNKTCTVRMPANGRFEYKLPDASVNPYLSHAVLIAAISDGLANELDPGPGQHGSSYDGACAEFGPIPLTLGDALDALAQDKIVTESLPADLLDLYVALKTDEWARYCGAVTDWEREMYWEGTP
ncbi:MAG: glutamine synthetase family protein [Haloechinothrix sp.]